MYKAVGNQIADQGGRQIAVVLAVGCTKAMAKQIAAAAVESMNAKSREKAASEQ